MPKKAYEWEEGEIPIIGDHSIAKHRILREYVQTYIEVLTKNPRIDHLTLTLVDGFAGGGIYRREASGEIHLGSPPILIEATAAALAVVNASRVKPVRLDAKFVFVEKKPEVVEVLDGVLQEHVYPKHPGVTPQMLVGAFEQRVKDVIKGIQSVGRAHRAIFLLDQYGYKDVPLPVLQEIFRSLPNAEVFLTLATGWISGYLRTASEAAGVLRERMGIRSEASEEEIEEKLLAGTDDAASRLRLVQRLLHDAFVGQSGARHFTPFFILSRKSNRPYWFLHLANSDKANDVVKELHWRIQNHFSHFGEPGLSMLGFDPAREVDPAQLSFGFDSLAEVQTRRALMEQLSVRVQRDWPSGVSFDQLFKTLTNETPATREMLRDAVTQLCKEGDLAKRGAEGQTRRDSTAVLDKDVIERSRQIRLFMK